MADDHNQRPYRTNAGAGAPSASDPLAELARLIGQNDPFSEFGRQPRIPPTAPAAEWPPQHQPAAAPPAATEPPLYGAPAFGREVYPPDLYQVEGQTQHYAAPEASSAGYPSGPAEFERDTYPPGQPGEFQGENSDDFYDDQPPNRRRIGILAIAGIFALAVIGTAGAFGYRAIFGSTASSGPPPVIKADTAPSKIVPAASKDTQANKQITDRVNERGQGEKLVSREEQPVAVTPSFPAANPGGNPGTVVMPPTANNGAALPQIGSGVVGAEPKRVRTIVIHPDGAATSAPAPERAAAEPPPAQRAASAPTPPQRPASQPQQQAVEAPRAEAPTPRQATREAAPVANAPLSLNPNAAPPRQAAPRAAAPARTAAVAPPARVAPAAASGGGYAVQVSSQRSEADAQSAFRSLQGKFPSQLGGKQALIKRVDLGAKGIYFRAMVGPFGSPAEAGALCSNLKSAGGSCLVQRN